MLARIQQSVVVSLLLMLSLWVTLSWTYSYTVTAVGLLVLAFGQSPRSSSPCRCLHAATRLDW